MFEKLLSANLSAALFPAVIVEALGHILHFAQTAREPTSALCVWIVCMRAKLLGTETGFPLMLMLVKTASAWRGVWCARRSSALHLHVKIQCI